MKSARANAAKPQTAATNAPSRLTAVPTLPPAPEPETASVPRASSAAVRGIRSAQPKWRTLVAVCKKCAGRPKHLQSELRKLFKKADLRDVRVVRTGCLDVCPQGGTCCSIGDGAGNRSFVVMHDTAAQAAADYITESCKP